MEYCAAVALAEGRVGIAAFDDGWIGQPGIRSLMGKVRMTVDPSLGGHQETKAWSRVAIALADGRRLVREAQGPRGHPDRPLPRAQLLEKFRDCARIALPAAPAAALAEAVGALEGLRHVEDFAALLR